MSSYFDPGRRVQVLSWIREEPGGKIYMQRQSSTIKAQLMVVVSVAKIPNGKRHQFHFAFVAE